MSGNGGCGGGNGTALPWEGSEIYAQELFRTCLRRVANAAVAANLGIAGLVAVEQDKNGACDTPHFTGRYQPLREPTADDWELIALAGPIAQCMLENVDVTDIEVQTLIESGDVPLSAAESKRVGEAARRDVRRCLRILRSCWPRILAAAQEMTAQFQRPGRRFDQFDFATRRTSRRTKAAR